MKEGASEEERVRTLNAVSRYKFSTVLPFRSTHLRYEDFLSQRALRRSAALMQHDVLVDSLLDRYRETLGVPREFTRRAFLENKESDDSEEAVTPAPGSPLPVVFEDPSGDSSAPEKQGSGSSIVPAPAPPKPALRGKSFVARRSARKNQSSISRSVSASSLRKPSATVAALQKAAHGGLPANTAVAAAVAAATGVASASTAQATAARLATGTRDK